MKKQILISLLLGMCTFSFSSAASSYVCEKGLCTPMEKDASLKPVFSKLYALFKTRNARIDFCEANAATHTCLTDGLNWYAKSPLITAFFSIPVARTLPQQNTLLIDYLVKANEFLPSCNFSLSTLEEAENKTIRLTSHNFACQVASFGQTQLQNTFFIDYIDFDNKVLGAKYIIQTSGAITGNSAGYALMKFRDGETLLPLVIEPYYGELPPVPNPDDAAHLASQINETSTASPYTPAQAPEDHPLIGEISTWWEELKNSVNLDKLTQTDVQEDEHWWSKFTNKLAKIIYLEPLE